MAVIDALTNIFGSYNGDTVTSQNVFSTDSSVVSGSSIDTTGATDTGQIVDLGEGQPLYLNLTVTTAFAGGTSAEFQAISSTAADLGTAVKVLASSGAIPIAKLTAGAKISVPIGKVDPRDLQRYIGGQVTCVGTVTAGAVTGSISPFTGDRSEQVSYQSGFTVS